MESIEVKMSHSIRKSKLVFIFLIFVKKIFHKISIKIRSKYLYEMYLRG